MTDSLSNPILMPAVRVARSSIAGYGVFAGRDFAAGEIVEESPVIDVTGVPGLEDYVFMNGEGVVLALGYGSLYNHAETPSLDFDVVSADRLIRFTAKQAIQAGEELTIYYGRNWFPDREREVIPAPVVVSEPKPRRYMRDLILLGLFIFVIFQVLI